MIIVKINKIYWDLASITKNGNIRSGTDSNGVVVHWLNGKYHNVNAPAVIYPNGNEEWWFEGELHRVGGPAIKRYDDEYWFINGKLHREDGPAVTDGDKTEYWFDGIKQDINPIVRVKRAS